MTRPETMTSDRLDRCRHLSVAAAVFVGLLAAAVGGHWAVFRDSVSGRDVRLMRRLDLPGLSPVPAGRLLATPDILPAGMDLRFGPGLPAADPDPAALLLAAPRPLGR